MVEVYLDTDCILALVKESDWLKEIVQGRIQSETKLSTSVMTIVECRLVLLREMSHKVAMGVETVLRDWNITLLPLDEDTLTEANKLMRKHDFLGTFDALHIATAILNGEMILSTDHVFSLIPEISVENPRKTSKAN